MDEKTWLLGVLALCFLFDNKIQRPFTFFGLFSLGNLRLSGHQEYRYCDKACHVGFSTLR